MKRKKKNTPPGFYRKELENGRIVFALQGDSLDIYTVHEDVKDELDPLMTPSANQFDCVRKHIERTNRFYWKVDLSSAFDSVTFHSVACWWDLPTYVRCCPMLFFHKDGGLIQGARASPKIFQLFCQRALDPYLEEFCRKNAIVYTRFADDLLFSSRVPIEKGAQRHIRDIIRTAGFRINEKKVVLADTFTTPIVYLGIRIFENNASVTEEFSNSLSDLEPGASKSGKLGWQRSVSAINRKKRKRFASPRKNG